MNKYKEIKQKLFNSHLKDGNKKNRERLVLKSFKELQKLSKKSHEDILKLAIKNNASALKMNKQKMKRRKRKTNQDVPVFIQNNSLRISISLKSLIINSSKKNEASKFYNSFANELLESSKLKSYSIEHKTEIQKNILLKKNLFFKFRWKKK